MDPQKLPDSKPAGKDTDKDKPTDSFTEEDTSKLSLSEEPTKPVNVVTSDTAETPPEPPKPPTSEGYSPLGEITPPSNAEPVPQPVSRKKKLGLFALIVGVVVVLLGASAAAYFGYYLPNQPENVLKSALVNSFSKDKANSVHFEGKASVTDIETEQEFVLDFNGATSHDGKLDFRASVDALVTTVDLNLLSVDGKSYFVKLDGLEGLPELLALTGDPTVEAYAPVFAAVNGQWYEINESLIEEWTGTSLDGGLLTDEDLQKLGQAYEQYPFLVVNEKLAEEKINGKDSHHYRVVIDKDKLESFVQALKDANLDSIKLEQKNVDDFSNMLMNVDFSKYPIEVWIDKETELFTQFAFKTEEDGAKFDVRLTITDYNKPVEVEEPEGAKSVLEALTELYEAMPAALESDVPDNMLESLESDDSEGVSL